VLAAEPFPVADARAPLLSYPGMAAAQELRAHQRVLDADESSSDWHTLADEAARSRLQHALLAGRRAGELRLRSVDAGVVHDAGFSLGADPLGGAKYSSYHVHGCCLCGKQDMSYASALRHASDALATSCLLAASRKCAAKTAADAAAMCAMRHRVTVAHIEQLAAELAGTQVAMAEQAEGALKGIVQAATKVGGGTWAAGVGYQQTAVARNLDLSPGDRKTFVACLRVRAREGREAVRFGGSGEGGEEERWVLTPPPFPARRKCLA
jgi:hypothetical protein